jgi:hypothetical protein
MRALAQPGGKGKRNRFGQLGKPGSWIHVAQGFIAEGPHRAPRFSRPWHKASCMSSAMRLRSRLIACCPNVNARCLSSGLASPRVSESA